MKFIVRKNYEYTNVFHVEADSAEEAEEAAEEMIGCFETVDEMLIETMVEDDDKVEIE